MKIFYISLITGSKTKIWIDLLVGILGYAKELLSIADILCYGTVRSE
jgi:hypothetical protein